MPENTGYQTDGETVTLTMTRDDYMGLVMALGIAAGAMAREGNALSGWLALADRLNAGNPTWIPYGIAPETPPKDGD